ncbi:MULTISPECIES: TlpA disulfide reductase family protein [Vitreoscilla]|uniref:TlpA family protein disulfide reductase n=1 Tax=Vitreoscilla stercoraria TaxID=61 RepID=A0ABY4EAT2_VITST|nr:MULTISPECIES: TlpA disulfide reductase family protein [Vitreoscilla]AUZ06126.1 thioredoxin [Vitreoscilla sp. C1]UOO92510.1 TlpA family protein disulfide reductase [Vitreoscilla stercoraria]
MKRWVVPMFVVALMGLVVFALSHNQTRPTPSFLLTDLNGQTVSEQSLQGKVTLINFWYPSCVGCVVEMPKLIETQAKFADSAYQTLAISLPYNTEAEVRAYVAQYRLPFIVAIDKSGEVGKTYQVQVAPNSFLVNQQGQIIQTYIGELDWQALHALIEKQLHP